jgi:diguanylate cyclase (GGDEF)-like protein
MVEIPQHRHEGAPPTEYATSVPGEARLQRILEMIGDHGAPADVLTAICEQTGDSAAGRQVAIFLLEGERWRLAANGGLTPGSAAAVSQLDPAAISAALWEPERLAIAGWACHLRSGSGELLGLMMGVADGPVTLFGRYAARIATSCRLAELAIEQFHLVGELACHLVPDAAPAATRWCFHRETLMQRVAHMIGNQCSTREILEVLCGYLGETEAVPLAFFVTDGESWRLAAQGQLTAQAAASLAAMVPEELSEALLVRDAAAGEPHGRAVAAGWARHLFSGSGELLGIAVVFADGPVSPLGIYATCLESVCCLATLAIEQSNLVVELTYQATHDALTGLLNRRAYERALASSLREGLQAGTPAALLRINLDRFRLVNDVLGPVVGNGLLQWVGRRIQAAARPRGTVARTSGDEFAVVLPGVSSREECEAVAGRLQESLSRPCPIEDHEIFVSVRIGIAISSAESTAESLDRQAGLALYQAKQAGTARWRHFHPSMATTPPERLEMEKRLRFALERGEMVLHYQPQVDLDSGLVRGVEALLRWRPEGLGTMVSPATFVPILEETGLIVEVGRWALREACRQGKLWADTLGLRLRMGVNVSAVQFALPEFVHDVEQALADTGMPAGLLELELTESLFVGDFEAARRSFTALHGFGAGLALDDFGTGQSALSYLRELPFRRLKIDQSFIRAIRDREVRPHLVHNIIRMANELGLSTIAEGVETTCQMEWLRSLGCEEGQGYLFGRPQLPDEVAASCQGHSTVRSWRLEPEPA